jgi:flagellar biosynthesis component FlhA
LTKSPKSDIIYDGSRLRTKNNNKLPFEAKSYREETSEMCLITDFEVVLGGIIVVFAGMVAIVGLVWLVSNITKMFEKNGAERAAEKEEKRAAKAAAKKAAAEEKALKAEKEKKEKALEIVANVGATEDEPSDDELIAVITAAVSVYMSNENGGRKPRFRVTSFKRITPNK